MHIGTCGQIPLWLKEIHSWAIHIIRDVPLLHHPLGTLIDYYRTFLAQKSK